MLKILRGESQLDVHEVLSEDVLQEFDDFHKIRQEFREKGDKSQTGIPQVPSFRTLKRMMSNYIPPDVFQALFSSPKGQEVLHAILQQYIVEYYTSNRSFLEGIKAPIGPISFEEFEGAVLFHRDKVFLTTLLQQYSPVAGADFKGNLETLIQEKAELEQNIANTEQLLRKLSDAQREGSTEFTRQSERLTNFKKKLQEVESKIRKGQLSQRIGQSREEVGGVSQYVCPECASPLWTAAGGNSSGDAPQSYHTIAHGPESPERDSQNVCWALVGEPVFSPQAYKRLITKRHFADDPQVEAQVRAEIEALAYEAYGDSLDEEELTAAVETGMENTAARPTKTYSGNVENDPYFIEGTANSVDDLPIAISEVAGQLGVEEDEIEFPLKYWQEICGYPVNLASPAGLIRKQLKQVKNSFYSKSLSSSKAPQDKIKLQVRCPCPESAAIIIADEVPYTIPRAKQIQHLQGAIARSMAALEESLQQDYPDDPAMVQELLKANQGTLACRKENVCQIHTVPGSEKLLPGRFKPDFSQVEKLSGGRSRVESLDVEIQGEGDDQDRSKYDIIGEEDVNFAKRDLIARFEEFVELLRKKLQPLYHDADAKIDIFVKYIQAHTSLLVEFQSEDEDEAEEMLPGTDGLMANLSRLMGKELHYSTCIYCGQQHDEPTHYDTFMAEGGVLDQIVKGENGEILEVRPGQGTFGKGEKTCVNVIDPVTQKRTKAHTLVPEEFQRIGVLLEQHANFDTWKRDQEFTIRYAAGGFGNLFEVSEPDDDEPVEDIKEIVPPEQAETAPVPQPAGELGGFFDALKQMQNEGDDEEDTEDVVEDVGPESDVPVEDEGFQVPTECISPDEEHRINNWPLTQEEILRLREHLDLHDKYFGLSFEYHPPHCGTAKSSRAECREHGEPGSPDFKEITMYINQPASKVITQVRKAITRDPDLHETLLELLIDVTRTATGSVDSSTMLLTKEGLHDSKRNGRTLRSFAS